MACNLLEPDAAEGIDAFVGKAQAALAGLTAQRPRLRRIRRRPACRSTRRGRQSYVLYEYRGATVRPVGRLICVNESQRES